MKEPAEGQTVRLAELRAPEWEACEGVVVLLPVGSVEQHGPHMPLGTDTSIAVAICEAACSLSPRLVLAPAIAYGVSHHHKRLPGGAVSVRPRAFVDYLLAVLSELADQAGARAAVVVNGHGGNWSSVACALDELGAARGELPVAACSWWQLVPDLVDGADSGAAKGGPGHAGAVETSLMLALNPRLVDRERVPEGARWPSEGSRVGSAQIDLYRWRDFGRLPDGVVGFPDEARVELGEQIVQVAAERLLSLALRLLPTDEPQAPVQSP